MNLRKIFEWNSRNIEFTGHNIRWIFDQEHPKLVAFINDFRTDFIKLKLTLDVDYEVFGTTTVKTRPYSVIDMKPLPSVIHILMTGKFYFIKLDNVV